MGVDSCVPYDSDDPLATIASISKEGHCPILSAPKEYRPLDRVLICFDNSPPSIRAMQWFAHLQFISPKELFLLTVVTDSDQFEELKLAQIRAEDYLRSYGFEVQSELIPSGSPLEQIESFIEEKSVDMAVLGPHSGLLHTLFFGSISRALLERGDLALFLID